MLPALAVLALLSQTSEEATPTAPAGANPPVADLGEWWKKLHPFGYVKAGVFYTFPFTNEQLIGGRGGFRIASSRFGLELLLADALTVVASIDIAAPQLRADDPLAGGRIVEMRDAYVEYRASRFAWIRAGQFKAPYDAETLLGDADLPFVTRSVATDGTNPPEAYGPRDGLTLGRQIGLQLSSDLLGSDAVGFRYFVAVVNGSGMNQLFNDNNLVVPVGRVEVELFKTVSLGVNGYYNVKAEGLRPNRLSISQFGYGVDAAVRLNGLRLLAGFLGQANSYPNTTLTPDAAMGVFAQVYYVLQSLGLEAGLRFAWLEPSTVVPGDSVWDLAAMVAYRFKLVPLRVLVQYTHREEEPASTYGNDSLDAMAQVSW